MLYTILSSNTLTPSSSTLFAPTSTEIIPTTNTTFYDQFVPQPPSQPSTISNTLSSYTTFTERNPVEVITPAVNDMTYSQLLGPKLTDITYSQLMTTTATDTTYSQLMPPLPPPAATSMSNQQLMLYQHRYNHLTHKLLCNFQQH